METKGLSRIAKIINSNINNKTTKLKQFVKGAI
jgi:hypothetical protein